MDARDYLWAQSGISLALLVLVGLEAVRRSGGAGMFSGGFRGPLLVLWGALMLALAARTVWQLAVPRDSGTTDALGRTTAAIYLAAVFLFVLALSSRATTAIKGGGTRATTPPLRSRLTWILAAVVMALALPVFMLGTRAALTARSAGATIPRAELARVAGLIAEKGETGGEEQGPRTFSWTIPPSGLVLHVHLLDRSDPQLPNAAVVCFQGSRTAAHWRANFSPSSRRIGGCCNVHGGWEELFAQQENFFGGLLSWLAWHVRQRDRPLVIAGHSLGGAMAQLLVFRMIAAQPALLPRTRLMLFGSPSAGDADFLERILPQVQDYANVVLPFDPIPALAESTFPPVDRQVVVVPASPNRLFMGAHDAAEYADALRNGGSASAVAESALFVAGLAAAFVGACAVIFNARLPRPLAALMVAAVAAGIWQLAMRASGSAFASFVAFGAGILALALGVSSRRGGGKAAGRPASALAPKAAIKTRARPPATGGFSRKATPPPRK